MLFFIITAQITMLVLWSTLLPWLPGVVVFLPVLIGLTIIFLQLALVVTLAVTVSRGLKRGVR